MDDMYAILSRSTRCACRWQRARARLQTAWETDPASLETTTSPPTFVEVPHDPVFIWSLGDGDSIRWHVRCGYDYRWYVRRVEFCIDTPTERLVMALEGEDAALLTALWTHLWQPYFIRQLHDGKGAS